MQYIIYFEQLITFEFSTLFTYFVLCKRERERERERA